MTNYNFVTFSVRIFHNNIVLRNKVHKTIVQCISINLNFGYGVGLWFLMNKTLRTNITLDYAWGAYGAMGLFLNENETLLAHIPKSHTVVHIHHPPTTCFL